jgi:hypothetical protein
VVENIYFPLKMIAFLIWAKKYPVEMVAAQALSDSSKFNQSGHFKKEGFPKKK